MTILARIRNSFPFRKAAAVAATTLLPENAPTAELTAIKPRVELPEISKRMIGVASRSDGLPNYRRRALFYEGDFYATFH
jgi:hypothetical protein